MVKILFLFPLMILLALSTPAAQAGDSAAALPPPGSVLESPAATETVEPPAGSDGDLSSELVAPEGDSNVEIRSSVREDGTKIEEYAHHGRVYMVKISPPHGLPPYYLYDNTGDGTFERHLHGGNKRTHPPEWVIKRF